MDYERLIKKEFSFLKSKGFLVENYTRNFEIEIYYRKNDLVIGLNYMSYQNSKVGCGIKTRDKNENILTSSMFDSQELILLNEQVLANIESAEKQIKLYADFLHENINSLQDCKK